MPSQTKASRRNLFARSLTAAVMAASLIGLTATSALGWGGDGHRAVAAVAIKLLSPEKSAALEKLMQSSEVGRSFEDSASYADEFIRSHDPEHRFGNWHFVNWPVAKPKFSQSFCGPHCLVSELPKQIELFAESKDNEVRALALSWIIHLVGDMHQPLHIADRNDQGGNQLFIQYPADEPGCDAGKQKLHHVWDDCLVKLAEQGKSWSDFADALRGNLTTYKNQPAARGTIMQWAKTSHDLARDVAYSGIKQKTALSAAYLDRSEKIVKSQILNAGIRLARIIDENFKLAP